MNQNFSIQNQRLRQITSSIQRSEETYYRMMSSVSNLNQDSEGPNIGLDYFQDWYGAISTVWKIAKPYLNDPEKVKEIEELREPMQQFALIDQESVTIQLEDIEEFHDKVQEARKTAGFDLLDFEEERY